MTQYEELMIRLKQTEQKLHKVEREWGIAVNELRRVRDNIQCVADRLQADMNQAITTATQTIRDACDSRSLDVEQ